MKSKRPSMLKIIANAFLTPQVLNCEGEKSTAAANPDAVFSVDVAALKRERDEAIEHLKNVSSIETGAEPHRVIHRLQLDQREIEAFLSRLQSAEKQP